MKNKFQNAGVKIEGVKGCVFINLGLLLNYPYGENDEFWYCCKGHEWQQVDLKGSWFPDAFIVIMNNVQRYDSGEDNQLITNVKNVYQTMKIVEACYLSDYHNTNIHIENL